MTVTTTTTGEPTELGKPNPTLLSSGDTTEIGKPNPTECQLSQAQLDRLLDRRCPHVVCESEQQRTWRETFIECLKTAILAVGAALAGFVGHKIKPFLEEQWEAFWVERQLSGKKQKTLARLWYRINPDNLVKLPETAFKTRAKELPLFKYLIADGLSMDALFDKIDVDEDKHIAQNEFFQWYDRLCLFRPDADENLESKLYTVFVGRARVGKSTLLNSFLGRPKFDSGMTPDGAYVGGVTQISYHLEMDSPEGCPRSFYVNLPGFLRTEEHRALRMVHKKALMPENENAYVKLVFVVTQEGGSVSEETRAVIKETLLISSRLQSYAVIVNKCSENFMNAYADEKRRRSWVEDNLTLGLDNSTPSQVFFVPLDHQANDAKKYLLPLSREFKEFIFSVPCNDMRTLPPQLQDVHLRAELEELEKKRQKMREEKEKERMEATKAFQERKRKADEAAQEAEAKRQKTEAEKGNCMVQ